MNGFTEKDKAVILEALNALLKSMPNALEGSGVIVPVAIKVQNIVVAPPEESIQ
jgi:hypothetical protein